MSNKNKPQYQRPQNQVVQQATFYQGIIPPPEDLAKYDQIQPGFANRIIKMTEDESAHRRKMERRIINNTVFGTYFGQILGFLSVCLVCYLCYFAFDRGFGTQAASIAVAVLLGLATSFKFFTKESANSAPK